MSSIGYGAPPTKHQFRKGVSGNPKGRPKGAKNKPKPERPHPFDEKMKYLIKGKLKRVPTSEALSRYARDHMIRYPSDHRIGSILLDIDERMEAARAREALKPKHGTVFVMTQDIHPSLGGVCSLEDALISLDFAVVVNEYKPSAKAKLDPRIVQKALDRLGDRRFTRAEQKKIVAQTHQPHLVKWPPWWEADLVRKRGPGRPPKRA